MNNIAKRKTLITVVICLSILLIVVSCLIILYIFDNSFERQYHEDIHIQLETRQAEIIIKEWSFLLGSGAEVYYKDDDKEILLGRLSGADDGFCPFKEGLYTVEVDDSKLTIEWCKDPSNQANWGKEIFELPSN